MDTKMQHKIKLIDRIYNRVMDKWNRNQDEARLYIGAAIGNLGTKAPDLICRLPLPLAQYTRGALALTKSNRQKRDETRREAIASYSSDISEKVTARKLVLQSQIAALTGENRIFFLAGLPTEDRGMVGTPVERKAAVALRKTAIMAGKVRAALNCTETELDRWNADGRLPHLYTRTMHFEKATPCRFWAASVVEDAILNVDAWRQQDGIKKQFKRRGLKIVDAAKRRRINV